jgi:nucleotide-binding universal stress UspA family protein
MSHVVGRVVVGVSGSPGSLQALRFAVGHARAFGAVLVPVVAWTPPGGELANRRYPVASLAREWQRDAELRLRTAFDEGLGALPNDLDVECLVVRGSAGHVLVEVADREGDLLVVGTGRRGILRRVVQGSVARHCLARARCTVIAVPPSPLVAQLDLPWTGLRSQRALRDGVGALDQATRVPRGRPQRDRIDQA